METLELEDYNSSNLLVKLRSTASLAMTLGGPVCASSNVLEGETKTLVISHTCDPAYVSLANTIVQRCNGVVKELMMNK